MLYMLASVWPDYMPDEELLKRGSLPSCLVSVSVQLAKQGHKDGKHYAKMEAICMPKAVVRNSKSWCF